MEIFVNGWGLYPWFEEIHQELVQPSDLARLRELQPYGKVFECLQQDSEFLTLRYKEDEFRVKPAIFRRVPTPRFSFGARVRLVNRPEVSGVVRDIHWHHQQNGEMYFLEIGGKKKSSRYFADELVADQDEGRLD